MITKHCVLLLSLCPKRAKGVIGVQGRSGRPLQLINGRKSSPCALTANLRDARHGQMKTAVLNQGAGAVTQPAGSRGGKSGAWGEMGGIDPDCMALLPTWSWALSHGDSGVSSANGLLDAS
jgi:hypothetical protein